MSDTLSPVEREAAEFRQEALDHYLHFENSATILRVSPPSIWILFWILTVAMIVAVTAACIANVEQTAAARAILGRGPVAVSYLPEPDRPFIKVGDRVHVDINQIPSAEFGALTGRVTRVANDLAPREELREAFAEQVPSYRVEIALDASRTRLPLRSGMVLNVHYTLRRQRLITVIFPPLKRWIS